MFTILSAENGIIRAREGVKMLKKVETPLSGHRRLDTRCDNVLILIREFVIRDDKGMMILRNPCVMCVKPRLHRVRVNLLASRWLKSLVNVIGLVAYSAAC